MLKQCQHIIKDKHGRDHWGWGVTKQLCNFPEKAKAKINTFVIRKDIKEKKVSAKTYQALFLD